MVKVNTLSKDGARLHRNSESELGAPGIAPNIKEIAGVKSKLNRAIVKSGILPISKDRYWKDLLTQCSQWPYKGKLVEMNFPSFNRFLDKDRWPGHYAIIACPMRESWQVTINHEIFYKQIIRIVLFLAGIGMTKEVSKSDSLIRMLESTLKISLTFQFPTCLTINVDRSIILMLKNYCAVAGQGIFLIDDDNEAYAIDETLSVRAREFSHSFNGLSLSPNEASELALFDIMTMSPPDYGE